jgi:hypothetical protein
MRRHWQLSPSESRQVTPSDPGSGTTLSRQPSSSLSWPTPPGRGTTSRGLHSHFQGACDGPLDRTGIIWHDVDIPDVVLIAQTLGITAYDASYLWLAGSLGADLIRSMSLSRWRRHRDSVRFPLLRRLARAPGGRWGCRCLQSRLPFAGICAARATSVAQRHGLQTDRMAVPAATVDPEHFDGAGSGHTRDPSSSLPTRPVRRMPCRCLACSGPARRGRHGKNPS